MTQLIGVEIGGERVSLSGRNTALRGTCPGGQPVEIITYSIDQAELIGLDDSDLVMGIEHPVGPSLMIVKNTTAVSEAVDSLIKWACDQNCAGGAHCRLKSPLQTHFNLRK